MGGIWFSPKSFWDVFYVTLFLSHFGCIVWFGVKVTLLLCFPGTSPPYFLNLVGRPIWLLLSHLGILAMGLSHFLSSPVGFWLGFFWILAWLELGATSQCTQTRSWHWVFTKHLSALPSLRKHSWSILHFISQNFFAQWCPLFEDRAHGWVLSLVRANSPESPSFLLCWHITLADTWADGASGFYSTSVSV